MEQDESIAKFKFKYGKISATPTETTGSASVTPAADTEATAVETPAADETAVETPKTVSAVANPEAVTLDKESITFEKDKISKDGKYVWYISGLELAAYNFELYALDKNGVELPGYLSAKVENIDLGL